MTDCMIHWREHEKNPPPPKPQIEKCHQTCLKSPDLTHKRNFSI